MPPTVRTTAAASAYKVTDTLQLMCASLAGELADVSKATGRKTYAHKYTDEEAEEGSESSDDAADGSARSIAAGTHASANLRWQEARGPRVAC